MSDFFGENHTKTDVNVPSEKIDNGEGGSPIRILYDKFTFTAIIDTTDALFMMKIPKGARVMDVIVKSADLGTTGDINVGWLAGDDAVEGADADGFFAALDVNAAAINTRMSDVTAGSRPGHYKEFSEEVQVVIVPSEITTATSGDIELVIEYII